jgi:hypothetical protein
MAASSSAHSVSFHTVANNFKLIEAVDIAAIFRPIIQSNGNNPSDNGHYDDICQFLDRIPLARLFSLLLVAVEPREESDFPFSLNSSVLTDAIQINPRNDDALQALKVLTNDPRLLDSLRLRIMQMNASATVHLGTNNPPFRPDCCLHHIALLSPTIISIPSFFEAGRHGQEFPLIGRPPGALVNFRTMCGFELCRLSMDSTTMSWVHGSVVELLLLLKQYSLMREDLVFVCTILIEHILVQLPLSLVFLPKLLFSLAQGFIAESEVTDDYQGHLLLLGSLLRTVSDGINPSFVMFYEQEKQSIVSPLAALLLPFFPEFCRQPVPPPADPFFTIDIPSLDIPDKIPDPLGDFLIYRSMITYRSSLTEFPFADVLAIWLALDEQVRPPPTVLPTNDPSRIHITNPSQRECVVHLIAPSSLPPNCCVLRSESQSFEDFEVVALTKLPKAIEFNSRHLFLSLISTKDMLSVTVEAKQTPPRIGDMTHRFCPANIHDEFIQDIRVLTTEWTPEHTQLLLSLFALSMLQQRNFQPFIDAVSESPLCETFPRKVIYIVSYVAHRLNFIRRVHSTQVPGELWRSVNSFVSMDEAAQQFVRSILTRPSGSVTLQINRREANRLVLTGHGKSIISQFADQVSRIRMDCLQDACCPWQVIFLGEDAIDTGGPRRELFFEIATSIFEPSSKLFIPSPNGRNHSETSGTFSCHIP